MQESPAPPQTEFEAVLARTVGKRHFSELPLIVRGLLRESWPKKEGQSAIRETLKQRDPRFNEVMPSDIEWYIQQCCKGLQLAHDEGFKTPTRLSFSNVLTLPNGKSTSGFDIAYMPDDRVMVINPDMILHAIESNYYKGPGKQTVYSFKSGNQSCDPDVAVQLAALRCAIKADYFDKHPGDTLSFMMENIINPTRLIEQLENTLPKYLAQIRQGQSRA